MTHKSLQFGAFRLDLARLSLTGPSGPITLRPKSFEVLRYLIEHAERVVSKDEVIAAVWPDVFVTEDSLTRCISEIRRAIGDSTQAMLKTVPRRGYLLDAAITTADEPRIEAAAKAHAPPTRDERDIDSPLHLPVVDMGGRKQATALYAAIVRGTDSFAEPDAEESLAIFETTLGMLRSAIERFGGAIRSIGEDGVLAVFGVPAALENHAMRACCAANEIRAAVGDQSNRHTWSIGLGVVSGEVVVRPLRGARDSAEIGVMGAATHRAIQLGRSAAGRSLISGESLRLVSGLVETRPLEGPGASGGSDVHELLAITFERSRFQAIATHGLTPFIGRADALAQCERAADKTRSGRGQIVAIIGEPGVGKSRLLHEFLQKAGTSWTRLEAATVAHRAPEAYQPLTDLLTAYFQIAAEDASAARHAKVVARLEALDSDLVADAPAHVALVDSLGVDAGWQALDPGTRRERIFESIQRLVLREALRRPTLLVLEDLHWIDGETQLFLDTLVDGLAFVPLLLVVTYRPHYEHRWTSKSYYSQVRLDEFSPEQIEAMLVHLVGTDPSLTEFKEVLEQQGNPLFLEESVRSLAEDQVLDGERGHYRLARPLSELRVPAAVQAILAARIDRLPPYQRHLLQAAACIGKDFSSGTLRAIAKLTDETFEMALAGLQNAEFLFPVDFSADRALTFKHALTHEVAYGSVLTNQRRQLHGEIVAAIERRAGNRVTDHVEQLAHHALRADLGEQAVRYSRQAGTKAFARSSNRDAVSHLERALVELSKVEQTRATEEEGIDIRCELRNALYPLARYDRIELHLQDALALAGKLGDRGRLGWVSAYLSSLYLTIGGSAESARELAARAESIAVEIGDTRLEVAARYYLAWANYIAADFATTEAICRGLMKALQGPRRAERFGVVIPAVQSRAYLAHTLAERGDFAEGELQGQEAIRLAEEFEHPFSISWACLALAHAESARGCFPRAADLLRRALGECERWRIGAQEPLVRALLGHVLAYSGEPDEGRSLLRRAVADYDVTGMEHFLSIGLVQLGEASLLAGAVDEARVAAERANALAKRRGERGFEAWVLRLLGDVAALDEDAFDLAEQRYLTSRERARALGMRPLAAHCDLALGKLDGRDALTPTALTYLEAASTAYRELGMAHWQEHASETLRVLGASR